MLEHGGKLAAAIDRYGHAREAWLDLSTGVNPQSYPVPPLPAEAWHRLPETSGELHAAACRYYGVENLLPLAGSQAAIQALPRLRQPCRVAVAAPMYAEHAHRWRTAGHDVAEVPHDKLDAALDTCDVMVVCNPNNPTGATIARSVLLGWAARLALRGGWLVVDEAFADADAGAAARSLCAAAASLPGLIVLRSVGKFFGLAGLRLGFAVAKVGLLNVLAEEIGPWGVSTAAQLIGTAALSDRRWQLHMREQLAHDSLRLHAMLGRQRIHASGSALFQWWPEPQAAAFAHKMAGHAILVRQFAGGGIRLGLPYHESDWQRLQQALYDWFIHQQENQEP